MVPFRSDSRSADARERVDSGSPPRRRVADILARCWALSPEHLVILLI
jgi:hypothetical protein